MIIGYKKQFPWGLPTFFKGKIIDGIKKHTIREDNANRWHEGRKINHCHGVRTKQFENFYNNDCTGTQEITILWNNAVFFRSKAVVYIGSKLIGCYYPDKKEISDNRIKTLAANDGFDSVEDFFKWFYEDYYGKIIHWTDLRY